MNKTPYLSIIIATLNSEKVLPLVLNSIQKQTFPKEQMEILIIDGGSTDNTKTIANRYKCKVIDNPKVIPAYAKYIGYQMARGKYAMFLDSDEIIESSQSIQKKMNVFLKNPSVRAVTGSGYKSPERSIFINQYINEFGDPFSFFFYRLSKDYRFFIESMKRKYRVIEENENYAVFNFSEAKILPIFELVAMGSIIDRHYFKRNFPEIEKNPGLIPHFFYLLVSKNSHIAITKKDLLIHYSVDTYSKYFGKITSRVVNNIFTSATEGFNGRQKFSSKTPKYKKYLFIPYALSLVFPFADSLRLVFTRKHMGYFMHIPLSLYTAILIIYYMVLRQIGFTPMLKSYGQEKKI